MSPMIGRKVRQSATPAARVAKSDIPCAAAANAQLEKRRIALLTKDRDEARRAVCFVEVGGRPRDPRLALLCRLERDDRLAVLRANENFYEALRSRAEAGIEAEDGLDELTEQIMRMCSHAREWVYDDAQKKWCETEFETSEDKEVDLKHKLEGLTAAIEEMEGSIATLDPVGRTHYSLIQPIQPAPYDARDDRGVPDFDRLDGDAERLFRAKYASRTLVEAAPAGLDEARSVFAKRRAEDLDALRRLSDDCSENGGIRLPARLSRRGTHGSISMVQASCTTTSVARCKGSHRTCSSRASASTRAGLCSSALPRKRTRLCSSATRVCAPPMRCRTAGATALWWTISAAAKSVG